MALKRVSLSYPAGATVASSSISRLMLTLFAFSRFRRNPNRQCAHNSSYTRQNHPRRYIPYASKYISST
jgi:hypothetical protein